MLSPSPASGTPNPKFSRALATAIAELRLHLATLSTARERQDAILQFAAERTCSVRAILQLVDQFGGCIAAQYYPEPDDATRAFVDTHGPSYRALSLCDDVWLHSWDAKPSLAYEVPVGVWQSSLVYKYIHSQLGHDHTVIFGLPPRTNGRRLQLCCVRPMPNVNRAARLLGERGEAKNQFTAADMGVLQTIGRAFADDLSARDPDGLGGTSPKNGTEELRLDAAFTASLTPHLHALISRFYGEPVHVGGGRYRLPKKMEIKIRNQCYITQKKFDTHPTKLPIFFSRRYHGRLLTGSGSVLSDGTISLRIAEDYTELFKLEKIMGDCRKEAHLGSANLLKVCFLVIDGVHDGDEIAKRLRLSRASSESDNFRKICARAIDIVYTAMRTSKNTEIPFWLI